MTMIPNEPSKSFLITGGCGFIGSHLAEYFLKKYDENRVALVVVLDKLEYSASEKSVLNDNRYTLVKGDIADSELVLNLLRKYRIDHILHFAAYTHVDTSFICPLKFTQNNIYGTNILLECARQIDTLKRFIFVSTDEVYGPSQDDLDETAALKPTNPYSASKASAELLCQSYYKSFNIPLIITRSNNVYGPRQYPEKIIPKFILRLMKGLHCQVHGDGMSKRKYLNVYDLMEAYDLIIEKGSIGETYNIGTSNDGICNNDLARLIIKTFDPESPVTDNIEHVVDRKYNDFLYSIDSTKIKQLGWAEKINFEDGLKETTEWYKKNGFDWWKDVSSIYKTHSMEN